MDDLDRRIEEALSDDDRAVFDKLGEQGLIGQLFGVYGGKLGGIAIFATIMTFMLFAAAVYCGWQFFAAATALEAARWGAGAVMLMVMVGFLKIWFWMRMESNRVLREVKRVELQLARLHDKAVV